MSLLKSLVRINWCSLVISMSCSICISSLEKRPVLTLGYPRSLCVKFLKTIQNFNNNQVSNLELHQNFHHEIIENAAKWKSYM